MKPVISLEKISFSYRKSLVLKDVSFSVDSGEFIGIFGPNGGGKTTLLKLIMGFLNPKEGKIQVYGQSPQNYQEKMAYVPQTLGFDRKFPISVMELVLMGKLSKLTWYGDFTHHDRKLAEEAIEKVGLKNFKYEAFGSLSGGQIQRALIARALVSQPKLLILDEPTSSLDPKGEEQIYELIQNLKKDLTILMVTHNLKTAVEQVDRLLCVQKDVYPMEVQDVCEHFAIGLYHPKLGKT